jgi:hypothetical protein
MSYASTDPLDSVTSASDLVKEEEEVVGANVEEEEEVAGARAKGKEPIVDARAEEKEPIAVFALTE